MKAVMTHFARLPRGVLVLACLVLVGTTFVACSSDERVFGEEDSSVPNDSAGENDTSTSGDTSSVHDTSAGDVIDDSPTTND
jgi:hypothetical protein